ncbi:20268_t:CDS:2, partial [Dentiscutata erythropus]
MDAKKLFTEIEWNELPRVDERTTEELRNILETTSYKNNEEPYDIIEINTTIMNRQNPSCGNCNLTDYEDADKNLQKPHLEGWHDVNVW